MTISAAISNVTALTGQVVSNAVLVRWLSEFDGRLALEFFREESFTPYAPTDLTAALRIPHPWDGVYVHHLEAMTYYTNGEYDRSANARVMAEADLGEYRKFIRRLGLPHWPARVRSGGGSGAATVVTGGAERWRYLSAYALAVAHGFDGGEEDWLASLKGDTGPAGADGTVAFDSLTPAQRAALKGEKGDKGDKGDTGPAGADGADGASGQPRLGSVSLSAAWTGAASPYSQSAAVSGVSLTAASRVDLLPTAAQLAALLEAGVTALTAENNAGALTVYALGEAPAEAMTLACCVTEVSS